MPQPEPVDWEAVYQALSARLPLGTERQDAEDVVHGFMLDRMHHVAEVVTRIPESDKRLAYIRASFRNYAADRRRREAKHERLLRHVDTAWAHAASADPFASERDPHTLSVDAAIVRLPRRLRAATRAHLGVGRPTASLREIATELNISRYAARAAVVEGLILVASALGRSGAIDSDDLEVAARFIRGETEAQIAAQGYSTVAHVRAAMRRVRALVERSLS